MPELPEIETIKNDLQSLKQQKIKNIVVRNKSLRYPIESDFISNVINKTILNIFRRAKYLIIELSSGYIIIHLGMSGRLTLENINISNKKHDHVDFILDSSIIKYNDPRRFGCIIYATDYKNHKLMKTLGIEPLENTFNETYLFNKLNNINKTIKQAIMDSSIVVGIGNIYASEALFLANILPTTKAKNLTKIQIKILISKIKYVLTIAIKSGGSTLKDYKRLDGKKGGFQNQHKVYSRSGKPCFICGNPILEIRISGRNTFYCNICQK